MAWTYPKRAIEGTYVLDIEPINQNFLALASETSGYLNEHNFKAGTKLVLSRSGEDSPALPKDIGFRLMYTRKESGSPSSGEGTNWQRFQANDFYQTKGVAGLSMTRTYRGGTVWICGSFNLHTHGQGRSSFPTISGRTNLNDKGFGFNCAIELDGAIIGESLVGSGDPTNENYDEGAPSFDTSGTPNELSFFRRGGGGINGAMNSIVVDAVVQVPPGKHTIRIAIMDIRASNGNETGRHTYVSTSELFALEMSR